MFMSELRNTNTQLSFKMFYSVVETLPHISDLTWE